MEVNNAKVPYGEAFNDLLKEEKSEKVIESTPKKIQQGGTTKCQECGFDYLKHRSPLVTYEVGTNAKGKVVNKTYICKNCIKKLANGITSETKEINGKRIQ